MPTSEAKLSGYSTLQYGVYDTGAKIRIFLNACENMSLDYRAEKDKNSVSLVEFYECNSRSGLAQIGREYDKRKDY